MNPATGRLLLFWFIVLVVGLGIYFYTGTQAG